MSKLIKWFKFHVIFRLALRFNWNYTTEYKGRVWSTRKGFDWRNQRIYFSGDMDFSPTSGGGYTELNDLQPLDSDTTSEASNAPK